MKKAITLTICCLLILELASVLSLWCLSLTNTPYPWSLFILLRFGYYGLGVGMLLLAGLPFVLTASFIKGGFTRWLSGMVAVFIILLLVSVIGGVALYQWWSQETFTSMAELFNFLLWLSSEPDALRRFIGCELVSFFLVFALPAHSVFELVRPGNKVLGNAHFANGYEIQKAGFFKKKEESLIIGKKYGVPLYSNGFEHVLVFAPSGSGKTRSIAIPNLFNYPYSVVCNDVKLTLFETTSGYRKNVLGHECYCFAPTHPQGRTHRFNPLASISTDENQRMTDIQRNAHILIPDNPKGDVIWTQASRKLFKCLTLYLLDTPERPTTLGEMNRLIKQQQFDVWLQDLLDNTNHLDPEFYRNGYSYINNHEKTRSSILESFSGYLELFDDPFIDAATSANDFDFKDLRRKKMTIYVGFSDDDMERLAPLLTLFWQQLISAMIREIPNPKKEPYPLLCLIDEFSSLGRIERLRRSLKLLREYRVRCILMFQYIAQTYEKYSQDEAKAFTNIKTKVAFTTEDLGDAEFISKMLGTKTQRVANESTSLQVQGISNSHGKNYQAVPLMRPEAIMKISAENTLIMRSGFPSVKASQFIWYKESFKALPQPCLQTPVQMIKRNPFKREAYQSSSHTDLL
ncbi:vir protein [Legionella quinlivanii]|uniref:Vir protein n=1 Tax=Legionella quinlivanii TaxID=45073 RepID=A0A0W0XSV7_9GAMM|nr:type IV secretory system conjugative DNA transfer family protein [Legionella quinlivanii]KTD47885.1 vir protein [Legionella quinlivanii]SEG37348.1 type IV secretion system protein VirD4 [Legionella quinlivanii DSM 21216]STY10121.1 protein LvhD4 [Legionella quinlivanii]